MPLYARISEGRVIEVFAHPTNPKSLFDPAWTWVECPEGTVGNATYDGGVWTNPPAVPPIEPPTPIDAARAERLAAVQATVAALLAAGAPVDHGGQILHVALDDGSRADMTAMAATALAAKAEALPWPASYALGWITAENIRIPLATPDDGLLLAGLVGDRYARIRQTGRTLKDAIIAAEDLSTIAAIDIESGWPT